LFALGAASGILAPVVAGSLRYLPIGLSAVFTGLAWWALLEWSGWTQGRQLNATLLAVSVLALGLGVLVRSRRVSPVWLYAWAPLALLGVIACVRFSYGQTPPWTLAVALVSFGVASLLLVPVLDFRLRELALGFVFLAGESAVASASLSTFQHLTFAVLAGLAAIVAAAVAATSARWRAWLTALLLYGALQSFASFALATSLWPDRRGLVAVLAIFGLETAVFGLALRRATVLVFAPPLLCASWLLFATQGAGGGDVQWVTVPIGIAILAVVEIARCSRTPEFPKAVTQSALPLLEIIGIAFVVGASLVAALTTSSLHGFTMAFWGGLISVWAVITRVRRRLQFGAAIATLGLLLVVAVPMARLVPEIRGVALWATLAGVGALLLLIATTLEQTRARVGAALRRLGELTEVWE
jgi:hypothetical protein